MKISDRCVKCLYNKRKQMSDDPSYLAKIRSLLDERKEDDCSPYMVYRFNQIEEDYFGKPLSYASIKQQYNELVLSMEEEISRKIDSSEDPLATAIQYARVGNYIDFGAMNSVDPETFLNLLSGMTFSEHDLVTYDSFLKECKAAKTFLLLADNCGEIVLDKLMLRQLKRRFPQLKLYCMVRGGEVLNDATREDADFAGVDQVAEIVTNGLPMAGAVYRFLPEEQKALVDSADVILAKGQGNYEGMAGTGFHVFYAFLCKCDLFTERFQVPRLTGMFVEER